MKISDYAEHFQRKGIAIPHHLLDRHKKALFHLEITEEYLARRLGESDEWWVEVVNSSQKALSLHEDSYVESDVIKRAKQELEEILGFDDVNQRTISLADWMDGWLNKTGRARVRNGLNSQLNIRAKDDAERQVRIPLLKTTRDKLSKLIDTTNSESSYDEMIGQLINFYIRMNGISLPKGEPEYKHRKKAGR